jgi:dTDP-4-amino-4,6-dideoxygalactose transaminase
MEIPFVDLKSQYLEIQGEIERSILNVLNNASFIGGAEHSKFSENLSDLLGVKNSILVANGTDAIYASLKMLGIGAGDEVITTAHSWISTSETISQCGATPIFIDTNQYNCIDVNKIEPAITEKTKAIIPVHLYGHPADMTSIMNLAERHGLYVIEDCAQAILTKWDNQFVGTFGSSGTISFFPGKNLGAYGDAGGIITNDDDFAIKLKRYTNHGSLVKHEHEIEGINSRMDNLQAAVLNVKVKYLNDWIASRREAAHYYDKLLSDLDEVETPKTHPNAYHTYHLYVIKVDKNYRDFLQKFLESKGIATGIHYPKALPELNCYKYLNLDMKRFPHAIQSCNEILSLPIYPEINEEQIKYVVDQIKNFFLNHR